MKYSVCVCVREREREEREREKERDTEQRRADSVYTDVVQMVAKTEQAELKAAVAGL